MTKKTEPNEEFKMRPLDRDLINRIVEEQANLPSVEDMDREIRDVVWAKYPPEDPFYRNMAEYSWAVESAWIKMTMPKDIYARNMSGDPDLAFVDPVSYELVLAYVYSDLSRPEVRKGRAYNRVIWTAMDEGWEGMPYPTNNPNPYCLSIGEYVDKHGDALGLVDFGYYRNLISDYERYFSYKYALKLSKKPFFYAGLELKKEINLTKYGEEEFLRNLWENKNCKQMI